MGVFEVAAVPGRGFFTVTMSGTWTVEDVHRFQDATRALLMKAESKPELSRLLCLSQDLGIPSGVVADALARSFAWQRMAIVSSSTITLLQVRRVFPTKAVKLFAKEDEAAAWLSSE